MGLEISRLQNLIGTGGVERLRLSHVAVFGIGGVGGHAVEALARSGVGRITLCDSDLVEESNLNRQIIALHSTIGRLKVDVAVDRIKDINPECCVTTYPLFYNQETSDQFDFSQYDYVVDAVDTVAAKISIVERCREAGVPVISAMGAGNKMDATAFRVADIYDTKVDPLARVMRRELKARGIDSLKCVYSQENPLESVEENGKPTENGKRWVSGSTAWVPSVVGLIMAGEVIKDLLQGN
ncbi:MAG: tRNA threonylcarbamoyladenosine dehydratase [Clostridia bacterium]|nr:tRNA threonylcarbamoyladenosine dehydratase [Clostridia bacterium]